VAVEPPPYKDASLLNDETNPKVWIYFEIPTYMKSKLSVRITGLMLFLS